METLHLSRRELATLIDLATELGLTVQEVAELAAKNELQQMCELPTYPGEVVSFEGLKRPREDKEP